MISSSDLVVYLVRHAQSYNNQLEIKLREENLPFKELWQKYEEFRVVDPQLSDRGIKQATLLADYVKATKQTGTHRLFCSAMHRSIHTAQHLSQALGVKPELWVDIFEEGGMFHATKNEVSYHGKTKVQIEELGVKVSDEFATGVYSKLTDSGWWQHGRETHAQCVERAESVVKKLYELAHHYKGKHTTLWLVAHGDFLSVLMKTILKTDLPNSYIYHDNCGVTQVAINCTNTKDGSIETKVGFVNRVIMPLLSSATDAPTDSPQHNHPVESQPKF